MSAKNRKTRKVNSKKKNYIKNRIIFLMILMIFGLLFVGIIRVIIIKVNNGTEFEKSAIQNQINKVQSKIIKPNRGSILDRNNQAIAISTTVFNVALDLRNIVTEKEAVQAKTMEIISQVLGIDIAKLNKYLEKDASGNLKKENDTHWKIISKKVSYKLGKELETKLKEAGIGGVYLEEDSQREYPYKNLAAQTVGFVMGDSSWGLENYYNEEMTGVPGRVFRTYEANNLIITRDIEPKKGNSIVTTLDLTIQQFAEKIVKKTFEEASPDHTPINTSLVVMKPKTGEIVAIAQYPDFDLNEPNNIPILEQPEYKQEYDKLSDEKKLEIKNNIWRNALISDSFEPGSTFKPVVVAAALDEDVINKSDTFYCGGYKVIGGHTIRCHKRTGHGTLDVEGVLAKSCNVGMMEIAEKLGKEKFFKYERDFGFGEKTGIDLNGEFDASNLIYPLSRLNVVELATSSFGQGFNGTPIQILTSFATVINGGNLMKPYLVSQVIDENGNIVSEKSPKILRRVISEETSDFLREALVATLSEDGTGKKAVIPGYHIGGKTGTAQQSDRSKNIYTLSFVAYLTAENPEYLALATIHRPKNYSDGVISPSPMIKELFENIIDYKAIKPSDTNLVLDKKDINKDEILLKDYSGKSLQNTIKELNSLGVEFQLIGSGGDTVTKHFPAGNTKVSKDTKILLYIDSSDKTKKLQVVPDTLNMSIEEATNLLKQVGFEVNAEEVPDLQAEEQNKEKPLNQDNKNTDNSVNSSSENISTKKVYDQIPQAGVYLEKGSIIKIKIK